jgi:hypothetical protein
MMSRLLASFLTFTLACSTAEKPVDTGTPPAPDADEDGYPDATDCDDDDPAVHPDTAEVPYDGIDNDCDPATVDDDLDGDGYLAAADCDDDDALRWDQVGTLEGDLATGGDLASFCTGWCERTLDGSLTLDDASPSQIAALECLTLVSGEVMISGNDEISDLDGLEQLRSVGQTFYLWGLGGVSDLKGLDGLETVGGNLQIEGDYHLRTLEGLESLASIGGSFFLSYNDRLTDPSALVMLASVGADVSVVGNICLDTATAEAMVAAIDSIGGEIFISKNGTDGC